MTVPVLSIFSSIGGIEDLSRRVLVRELGVLCSKYYDIDRLCGADVCLTLLNRIHSVYLAMDVVSRIVSVKNLFFSIFHTVGHEFLHVTVRSHSVRSSNLAVARYLVPVSKAST